MFRAASPGLLLESDFAAPNASRRTRKDMPLHHKIEPLYFLIESNDAA
jgi:hypothetical protein